MATEEYLSGTYEIIFKDAMLFCQATAVGTQNGLESNHRQQAYQPASIECHNKYKAAFPWKADHEPSIFNVIHEESISSSPEETILHISSSEDLPCDYHEVYFETLSVRGYQ
ncbi:hypothetical protein DPMN_078813 [Dreissena polymorpha]|uniref:Uncharacterized protein n=1 Tax=Dreissena polymorpha TaxID=45954 RepID=A0A9D3YNE3_DREPO|nr:hypothetical protein DPMN_078813 [Dreissena polymorpha]